LPRPRLHHFRCLTRRPFQRRCRCHRRLRQYRRQVMTTFRASPPLRGSMCSQRLYTPVPACCSSGS